MNIFWIHVYLVPKFPKHEKNNESFITSNHFQGLVQALWLSHLISIKIYVELKEKIQFYSNTPTCIIIWDSLKRYFSPPWYLSNLMCR